MLCVALCCVFRHVVCFVNVALTLLLVVGMVRPTQTSVSSANGPRCTLALLSDEEVVAHLRLLKQHETVQYTIGGVNKMLKGLRFWTHQNLIAQLAEQNRDKKVQSTKRLADATKNTSGKAARKLLKLLKTEQEEIELKSAWLSEALNLLDDEEGTAGSTDRGEGESKAGTAFGTGFAIAGPTRTEKGQGKHEKEEAEDEDERTEEDVEEEDVPTEAIAEDVADDVAADQALDFEEESAEAAKVEAEEGDEEEAEEGDEDEELEQQACTTNPNIVYVE